MVSEPESSRPGFFRYLILMCAFRETEDEYQIGFVSEMIRVSDEESWDQFGVQTENFVLDLLKDADGYIFWSRARIYVNKWFQYVLNMDIEDR